MKQLLFSLLIAALALPLAAEKKLTADELAQALETKKDVFLLDVREPNELVESGVIDGYVNIPLGQLEARLKEVPKDKIVITMCMRGGRAGRAAEILEKAGYQVYGSCGIVPYKEAGYKTSTVKK